MGPEALRAAYRARLRATHPDLRGGGDGGTAEVVEAYRLLRGEAVVPGEPAPFPAPPGDPVGVSVDGDTVTADLPAGDLFGLLVDAGHALGEVAHVDPEGGLLEVVVDLVGYGTCSVLLTLQGRAAGHTEAWCTVEALGGGPAPPAGEVAELLAGALWAVVSAAGS